MLSALSLRPLSLLLYALSVFSMPYDAARAECPKSKQILVSNEFFHFLGYDAEKGLVSIRLAEEIPLPNAAQLLPIAQPDDPLLLPLKPASMQAVLDAAANDQSVELLIQVQPLPALEAQGICARYLPAVRALHVAGSVVSQVAPGETVQARATPARPSAHVGKPSYEPRSPQTEEARLRQHAQKIAQHCLRGLPEGATPQGALNIELRTSLLGEREPPRVAVDGLKHKALTQCLLQRLLKDAQIWRDQPAGLRLYLPFYFRSAAPAAEP